MGRPVTTNKCGINKKKKKAFFPEKNKRHHTCSTKLRCKKTYRKKKRSSCRGEQGVTGPQGNQGPPGMLNQITDIIIKPNAKKYFYFAAANIESPIVIPASQFMEDGGALTTEFTAIGLNSYANVYINGLLQEGSLYRLSTDALTLNIDGDIIFAGTPIIVEIVQFFAQIVS